MKNRRFQIQEGDLKSALRISRQIPELEDPYDEAEYLKRLARVKHLVLTAVVGGKPVAFKVGYDRFQDGSFYTWMGGVNPRYRRQGLATALADYQEEWARRQGFTSLRLKTRRKHDSMIRFALDRGFRIERITPRKPASETTLWLEKLLGNPAN